MDRVKHARLFRFMRALFMRITKQTISSKKELEKALQTTNADEQGECGCRSVRELVVNDSHILPVLHVNEQKEDHFENER